MQRKVLITGVAGFIGSNLAAQCVKNGWIVDGVDDLSSGKLEFVHDEVYFSRQDFSSESVLQNVEEGEYSYIFHLAAQPSVPYSVEYPVVTNEVNVTKTLKLLNAARGKVKRFVFASSSSVYGQANQLPTHEFCAKNPESPYALQKSIIEDYLLLYSRLYQLDSVALRFFNVFGKHQLGNSPYSTAVSAWLHAIYSGGSMRSDGDGTQSRDMVHVDNIVHALILAAECDKKLNGETFNVGTGESFTNNEILEYLKYRFPSAKSHPAPVRVGDVKHTRASLEKIDRNLGYKVIKPFWAGLDETIEWIEKNTDLFLSSKSGKM